MPLIAVALLLAALPAAAEEPPRAVFFGSSTTGGYGASAPERRWTARVAAAEGWVEVNRGLGGSTLAESASAAPSGLARWREAVLAEAPDIVVVQYGANDIMRHVPVGAPDEPGTFAHALREVLDGLRAALPDALLVLVEPQPGTVFAGREGYDAAIAAEAERLGVPCVHAGRAFDAGLFTADRIHLDDDGHAALAEYFLAALHARAASAEPPVPFEPVEHVAPAAEPPPAPVDAAPLTPAVEAAAAP